MGGKRGGMLCCFDDTGMELYRLGLRFDGRRKVALHINCSLQDK